MLLPLYCSMSYHFLLPVCPDEGAIHGLKISLLDEKHVYSNSRQEKQKSVEIVFLVPVSLMSSALKGFEIFVR